MINKRFTKAIKLGHTLPSPSSSSKHGERWSPANRDGTEGATVNHVLILNDILTYFISDQRIRKHYSLVSSVIIYEEKYSITKKIK